MTRDCEEHTQASFGRGREGIECPTTRFRAAWWHGGEFYRPVGMASLPCNILWENRAIGAFELPGWAIRLRCLELSAVEVLCQIEFMVHL